MAWRASILPGRDEIVCTYYEASLSMASLDLSPSCQLTGRIVGDEICIEL